MLVRSRVATGLVVLLLGGACSTPQPQQAWLGEPEYVAPGVELYRATDPTLVDPAGAVAAHLLRLDPEQVRIESALANGRVLGVEPVDAIAARLGAVAAVNGGFFNLANGEPLGLLKVAGELVSDTGLLRGAVIIHSPADGVTDVAFDRVTARMSLSYEADGQAWSVPVDGVDTTRARGRLMLYTPAYHTNTDTAPNGTEWILGGDPLRVLDVRSDEGRAPIPRDGAVLSYGGLSIPDSMVALMPGVEITFDTTWTATFGSTQVELDEANHVVGGAGLIRQGDVAITEWTEERVAADFPLTRHPRTLIGLDRDGFVWLATIDGRQPTHSVGMAFTDLQHLSERLDLTDALNLDGGGSTTMVVDGRVVNRPSDATGPRAVSDAIVVTLR